MIIIIGSVLMLISMTSAIQLVAYPSPTVTMCPSVTVQQFPAASLYAKHCYAWGQSAARRDDYTYTPGIGGHKLHSKTVPWNEARLICEEEGGHLAIINSIAESKVIANLFEKLPAPPGTNHPHFAHVGFHDLFKHGQFVTVHGEPIAKAGFTEWTPGQPDNSSGNEHCGSVHHHGQLNDITCSAHSRFICEIPMPLT